MDTSLETEQMIEPSWPTLLSEALYGLSGDIVRELERYTEADPVALLSHVLAEFSCFIGKPPAPKVDLGGIMNPMLFWPVNTGPTAKGRKGTAKKQVELFFDNAIRDGLKASCGAFPTKIGGTSTFWTATQKKLAPKLGTKGI